MWFDMLRYDMRNKILWDCIGFKRYGMKLQCYSLRFKWDLNAMVYVVKDMPELTVLNHFNNNLFSWVIQAGY